MKNHFQILIIYNDSDRRKTVDSILKGKNKTIWMQSLSNEWGRLAQGNDRGVKFTDTIDVYIKRKSLEIKLQHMSPLC